MLQTIAGSSGAIASDCDRATRTDDVGKFLKEGDAAGAARPPAGVLSRIQRDTLIYLKATSIFSRGTDGGFPRSMHLTSSLPSLMPSRRDDPRIVSGIFSEWSLVATHAIKQAHQGEDAGIFPREKAA
jgi:hypothetical protein